ncbi:uncharacterized protein LOC142620162 [Castanea sativa]|uniref:uncharacterized protein LOC142620162 n=1 Tax=Castanea sativa TaxID=21020 RepID=UPI003F652EC5
MRFRVPKSLISDNGLQFDSRAFREFCSSLGITNWYSTPAYLQSNGQAKATNKAIVNGLKRRLEGAKGSARVLKFNPAKNSRLMLKQLNLLEKRWKSMTIRLAKYQQKLARRYNRDVREREFGAGDLVLRKAVGNMQDVNAGKLAPTSEGPYKVTTIAGAGAYYLEDLDKRPLPWP